MKKIANYLTDYICKKGIIKEEDYSIYNYGFQSGLELSFCLCICFIIAVIMGAFYEGFILWGIFLCVRSYAGGVHLKKYRYCLICSCIVYSALLKLNSWKTLNGNVSLCLCFLCTFAIVTCAGMHTNIIDKHEQNYFRSKLIKRLAIIILTSVVFYIYKCTIELSMISYSLCAIAISVIIQCINAYKIHHMRTEC